jgi:hypothetical protein
MRPTAAERRAQHFAEFKREREQEDQERPRGQRVSFGGDRGEAQLARLAQPDSSAREPQSSAIAGAAEREPPEE